MSEPGEDEGETGGLAHPRENPDIIGCREAEAAVLAAWGAGRMPHGWLICGAKGAGKATLAHRIARFVLTNGGNAAGGGPSLFGGAGGEDISAPKTLFVDPEHPVFRRASKQSHADLLCIERRYDEKTGKFKSFIEVNATREIGAFLSLTPGEGAWRVVIIDTADDMNINAANAVLKVLEEPPARTLLMLLSEAPGGLLPTIRSRCRRLDLAPVPRAEMESALTRMRPETPPEILASAVTLAGGSPGAALAMIEDGGLDLFAGVIAALVSIGDGKPDAALIEKAAAAAGAAGDTAAMRVFFAVLSAVLHGTCALIAGRTPDRANGPDGANGADGAGAAGAEAAWRHPDIAAVCRRFAERGALDRWLEVWDNLQRSGGGLARLNLDRRQTARSLLWSVEQAAQPA
ncbi:MAG: DNA polymerase III subunit delta' [Rhodospirillales bacterium]